MCEKLISSAHIQKLGHDIFEIRQRALYNIISKLNNGFVFDNDLARSKEIISKLFYWFLFESCSDEEAVFSLIKRTLQTESGRVLIQHYGPAALKKEIEKIRTYTEPRYHQFVDELLQVIDQEIKKTEIHKPSPVVPPLECDVPLSYRTGESDSYPLNIKTYSSRHVETTATPIESFIHQDKSWDHQTGKDVYPCMTTYTKRIENRLDVNCLPNYLLDWQPLIQADSHVLKSVEASLKNPLQPSGLLQSCEFFTDVLLHDFPAEVFLQRPSIVLIFLNILTSCPSTRITNGGFECLLELTKALQVRIKHLNDPSLYNLKTSNLVTSESACNSPGLKSSEDGFSSSHSNSSREFDKPEDLIMLRNQQLSLPHFCFETMEQVCQYLCQKPDTIRDTTRHNLNQIGVINAVLLLKELLGLLKLVITPQIWTAENDAVMLDVIKQFTEVLIKFGDTLEHFRLETKSEDNNLNNRVVYLYLCSYCMNVLQSLVPVSKCATILPRTLKVALSHCLIDVTSARLYPKTHKIILEYVQGCCMDNNSDLMQKYKLVDKICISMTAALKLLKSHVSLETTDVLCLMKDSLPCLEFHKDLRILKIFVDTCANKLPLYSESEEVYKIAEDVVLCLLSHNLETVKEEMYSLCQKKTISAIGPKLNMTGASSPGSQVFFLLSPKILTEISLFGITNENIQIKKFSEDILVHILKCKILVSDEIWNRTLEAVLPSFPIMLCHCGKTSSIGRILLEILDPDMARTNLFPALTVLKGNVQLLFSKDQLVREEAYSRLCWLLSSQEDARDFLPRLNNLNDKALANVCQVQRISDVNKLRHTQHFYQPSSLEQVLEMLKSSNVEPVIRRSALSQVSVMMEDPLLHQTFLENDGLDIVIDVMKSALIERNFRDYPDSVIPAISILKNLSLYHSTGRLELSMNPDVFHYVLRGIFMFFPEERLRQDASTLLFLLLFSEFCSGNPSTANFAIPLLVSETLDVPFKCNTYWAISQYTDNSLILSITSDKWCLSSIQIHWNLEKYDGFSELLKLSDKSIDLLKNGSGDGESLLSLNSYDFQSLKYSSIDYCVKKYLDDIQNGTSHKIVIEAIHKLTIYVSFYQFLTGSDDENFGFFSHPWEETFSRFFKLLPSSEEDARLLSVVISFLALLLQCYKLSGEPCWISNMLKNPYLSLLDVIHVDSSTSERSKLLSRKLLKLITMCVSREQHYVDYFPSAIVDKNESSQWATMVKNIADSLKFSDTQHFYNLAYLDSLLSCLVNLTAMLGWSGSKADSGPKTEIKQMIVGLCELVGAFHCGKGATAAVSVMGLSITRHALLILNHLLAELQFSEVKGCELCFLPDVNQETMFQTFISLLFSRCVVIRAAALQLFSGLVASPRVAVFIVNEVSYRKQNIWELSFGLLIDQEEASVVKENAGLLLTNLSSHSTRNSEKTVLIPGVDPYKIKKSAGSCNSLWNLIEDYQLYPNLEVMLNCLYTTNGKCFLSSQGENGEIKYSYSEKSWSSSSESSKIVMISTPALIKAVLFFLLRIVVLDSDQVTNQLHERGIIKLIFKCLCNPNIEIKNTKELSLYCDILEMNITVCSFLSNIVARNTICLGTVLHTKDCLNMMMSLLNPRIYHTNLPQLIYLRNKLWSEVFSLIGTLVECCNETQSVEALNILSDTMLETGRDAFLETLCEAIGSVGSTDLQTSALSSLTSLLKVETSRSSETDSEGRDVTQKSSMQSLLDDNKTPKTAFCNPYLHENEENIKPKTSTLNQHNLKHSQKMNILEDAYFGKILRKKARKVVVDVNQDDDNNMLMAGAEICKILLHLYDVCNVRITNGEEYFKRRSSVVVTLTNILSISQQAKNYALENGLLEIIVKQLKEHHIKLSLESAECLKRIADRKRVSPLLREVMELIGMLTNFMLNDYDVKSEASYLGVADLIHKLWVWFPVQRSYLIDVLKMLSTFTSNCDEACQSLMLTSPVAGTGPRKTPTNVSLLHALINLLMKEMDQISKTHDLAVLRLCFDVLHNGCAVQECRIALSKTNLLNCLSRLHPAITKRQKPWDSVEHLWLEFLQTYTFYPEGQAGVAKIPDALEVTISLTNSGKVDNKFAALLVLRNIAFHPPNRPRLLISGDFINILQMKLSNGTMDEKNVVVLIMWALAANSQRAKLVLKSAHLDDKLQDTLKQLHLLADGSINKVVIERMQYVLNILRDGDKYR